MSVIVLCVYGPSARLPFWVICNVGPELSFVLVPRSLMPDSSSARFGGAGSSVRSDILYIGSVITSESPHVARAHFGGLTGDTSLRGFAAQEVDPSAAVLGGRGTLHIPNVNVRSEGRGFAAPPTGRRDDDREPPWGVPEAASRGVDADASHPQVQPRPSITRAEQGEDGASSLRIQTNAKPSAEGQAMSDRPVISDASAESPRRGAWHGQALNQPAVQAPLGETPDLTVRRITMALGSWFYHSAISY